MSPKQRSFGGRELRHAAPVFAALGDETRLRLMARLGEQACASITSLAEQSPLTRQAITKHLRVLEHAGLVRSRQAGRERLFEIRRDSLEDAFQFLERLSREWDQALARLKSFVEG
jgi:DNA-binding transcriptional ArsR family regulator